MAKVVIRYEEDAWKRASLLADLDNQSNSPQARNPMGKYASMPGVKVLELDGATPIKPAQAKAIAQWLQQNPDGKMVVVASGEDIKIKGGFLSSAKPEKVENLFKGADVTVVTQVDMDRAQDNEHRVTLDESQMVIKAAIEQLAIDPETIRQNRRPSAAEYEQELDRRARSAFRDSQGEVWGGAELDQRHAEIKEAMRSEDEAKERGGSHASQVRQTQGERHSPRDIVERGSQSHEGNFAQNQQERATSPTRRGGIF